MDKKEPAQSASSLCMVSVYYGFAMYGIIINRANERVGENGGCAFTIGRIRHIIQLVQKTGIFFIDMFCPFIDKWISACTGLSFQ